MTQTALMFLGVLAFVCTLVLFAYQDKIEKWTRVVIAFFASILWGLFGMSSFDVIVSESYAHMTSEPILPLVYVGFGLAILVALYALYDMVTGFGEDATDITGDQIFKN